MLILFTWSEIRLVNCMTKNSILKRLRLSSQLYNMSMKRKKKQSEPEIDVQELAAEGTEETPPAKREVHHKIPNRRYLLFVGKPGGPVECWASVSTGPICAEKQFDAAQPGYCVLHIIEECYVDPEKYKANPVYRRTDLEKHQ